MKKQKSAYEEFMKLTPSQRAKATAEFDQEFIVDTFKSLRPQDRKHWERLKRGPGRPKVGKGADVVSVSIERTLLEQSDSLAKKLRVSRAGLIARGLKAMLAANGHL